MAGRRRPYVMARLRQGEGVDEVAGFLVHEGGWCYETPSPDIYANCGTTILSKENFSYENLSHEKSSLPGPYSRACVRQLPH